MDELLKNEQLGNLYAYYGSLLTSGQRAYFEAYYFDDLSLGEIADNHQVSRQAVYDNLRRSSRLLKNYEEKLHLQQSYEEIESSLNKIVLKIKQASYQEASLDIDKLLGKIRGE